MNRDDVGKSLDAWVGKGSSVGKPFPAGEVPAAAADDMAQLNFKVPQSMKRRIKQLAARDSITLLAMLYHMVDLYESKHGALGSR